MISLIHGDDEPSQTKFISPASHHNILEPDLPQEIPPLVEIEYLPCVATFDSYEDETGKMIRYLVKLEYHGENGTLVKGQSLAPFFDDDSVTDGENPFPGIAAVAVGCGIDADEDVEKITSFIKTLSASCQQVANADGEYDGDLQLLVECVKCNAEYSSMKEENDAYRNLTENEKQDAILNQTIGPGKMAQFVYEVAQMVVRQRWNKELELIEQRKNNAISSGSDVMDVTKQLEEQQLSAEDDINLSAVHIPDPKQTRYACKRCRQVLFGDADLEDPPHAQSLHNFRKKPTSKATQSKVCANHFLANPLPWMTAMDGMEGKLHCFKCETKIGHYSWTGAQCSCGTWVTPAIMIPVSKVDEMLPGGSIFVDPSISSGAIRMPMIYGAGVETSSNVNVD